MSRDTNRSSGRRLTANNSAREERRAKALRANLRRRKAQARGREAEAKGCVVEDKSL